MRRKQPLVSICIPNYNYGHYLRHCIESVINQTYENIEILVQDNNSSDDSYDILMEYEEQSRHGQISKFINVARNKQNVGSDRNCTLLFNKAEGKYLMYLSSDDALKPDMVERCVGILENNQDVSMVMVHRDEIDENGNLKKTVPFYDRSFVASGESQAAVFMMAGIAVPSQVFVRTAAVRQTYSFRNYSFQVAGDWYANFCYSLVGDIGYIHDALCEYRVHTGNETSESEKRLLGVFEHYVLINAFRTTAETVGYQECIDRYPAAVAHLAPMCLRYAMSMIRDHEFNAAKRYLYLAPVFSENIKEDERYDKLWEIVRHEGQEEEAELIKAFDEKYSLVRTKSYEPPKVFWPIDEQGKIVM